MTFIVRQSDGAQYIIGFLDGSKLIIKKSSGNRPKIWMLPNQRNLQARSKIKKYDRNIKSTNQIESFSKKVCLIPQNWVGSENLYESPTKFSGLTQNYNKLTRTPNLSFKPKNFIKKSMFRTQPIRTLTWNRIVF
jgi:hypothetical protein